jgi:acetyl esterase/lipase
MEHTVAAWYLGLTILIVITAIGALLRIPAGRAGLLYFFVGFPAFHFPGVLLIVLGLASISAAWLGALGTARARVGLAIALVAAWALLAIWGRARRTAEPLQRALDEALGGSRLRATARVQGAPSELPAPRLWSNPRRVRLPGVECIENLSYGGAGERNLLDLYRPVGTNSASRLPVLLWIHGGGWMVGHKAQQGMPLIYRMAKRGWIAVAINYRLAPACRFPDPIIDIKLAIAWLRRHGSEYGADGRFIMTCGGSAGAHLATLAALTPNLRELQPGFEGDDTTVSAAVPLYGRFDFIDRSNVLDHKAFMMSFLGNKVMPCRYDDNPRLWDLVSPIAHVGTSSPPMLVVHGTHDSMIPPEEARAFVTALRGASKQAVAYAELQGAQHAWDLYFTPWSVHTADAIYDFAEHCLAQHSMQAISPTGTNDVRAAQT